MCLKIFLLLAALATFAAACGRASDNESAATSVQTTSTAQPDSGGTQPEAEQTTTTAPDICETTELQATEIGVTEDTITVLVMADVGSTLAPGLFQGSIDGTKAWANHVNANGGLACRQIEVIEHDSQILAVQTTNGFLRACEEALAMVGSTALFATDVRDLNTCPDQAGNPTGVPDIAERAVEAVHSCSPNTFAPTNGVCPYSGSGPREYHNMFGPYKWLYDRSVEAGDPLHGVFLIPSDLPSAINSSMPNIRAHTDFGIVNEGEFGVSGLATQASYAQYIEVMRSTDSNYAYTGSNDQSMLKWKNEAEVQGMELDDIVWACAIACYTPEFKEQPVANGTYIWLPFLPFEEASTNQELATFISAMGDANPPSWAAGAWVAGRLFENAVNQIVADGDPNAITRQAILDQMRSFTDFDANGWYGSWNLSTKLTSPCYVMLQVQNNEFVRVHPQEPGTFDCDPGNVLVNVIDSAEEFGKGPDKYLEERRDAYVAGG